MDIVAPELERVGMPLHDAGGVNSKNGAMNDIKDRCPVYG